MAGAEVPDEGVVPTQAHVRDGSWQVGPAPRGGPAAGAAVEDLPLTRHFLFRSSNPEEVREHGARLFGAGDLGVVGRGGTLDLRQHSARLGHVSIHYVHYGGEVRIGPGTLRSFVIVQLPLSGHARVSCGGHEVNSSPALASVLSPAEPLSMEWSADCAQMVVRIEREALEQELSDLVNRPVDDPVRFHLGMDLTSGPARSWSRLTRLVVDELDCPDSLVNHSLAVPDLAHMLMTGLLLGQPHNYTPLLMARQGPHSQVVDAAVQLIDRRPSRLVTVAALAREVNVSVRALQEGFRRHLGTSPTRYMRMARLRGAHMDLVRARPDSVTVAGVAHRWGFTHVGRFSTWYRQRYDESPSETLRQ